MILLALLLATASPDKPSWTCAEVRAFVASHGGAANAERVARESGAPVWFIRWARRCLKK